MTNHPCPAAAAVRLATPAAAASDGPHTHKNIATRACTVCARGRFDLKRAGFTLLELMVVIAVIAIGTAVASLALRDSGASALARDADRLAALLESARAQSRAAGVPVSWRATASGFAWAGLPPGGQALPTQWLDPSTRAVGHAALTLGPDAIIDAQAVVLQGGAGSATLQVATDGLRPFAVAPFSP